jgi:hypothetical protein
VDFIPDRANVDDVGEFTIITQNAGAEAGYGASQVQLVTPAAPATTTALSISTTALLILRQTHSSTTFRESSVPF